MGESFFFLLGLFPWGTAACCHVFVSTSLGTTYLRIQAKRRQARSLRNEAGCCAAVVCGRTKERARNEPFAPWAEAWGDRDEASYTHMHDCVCACRMRCGGRGEEEQFGGLTMAAAAAAAACPSLHCGVSVCSLYFVHEDNDDDKTYHLFVVVVISCFQCARPSRFSCSCSRRSWALQSLTR